MNMMKTLMTTVAAAAVIGFGGWFMMSSNVNTPAGYVGYVTQGAIFGKTTFTNLQTGPTSSGLLWMAEVTNVSITPYTYDEDFLGGKAVLSSDNMKIEFSVHVVWKVNPDKVKEFVEKYSTLATGNDADTIVQTAYNNFLREPLRTYARDEIQKLAGMSIKEQITPAGEAIFARVMKLTADTPFEVTSVVVGNIQYPEAVANAVANKMAKTQELEQKASELAIAEQDKKIRIVQAEGIAAAMDIIQAKLTPNYLQHEAIEAQKAMVGSPNHTTVYIPVGNMGVPLVNNINAPQGQ